MFIFEENDPSNYLDVENEDLAVTNLLNKFDIQTETSFLYNLNDDYKALIDYISELYIEEQEIPEEIVYELNNNLNFKAYLLIEIREKMNNILSNNNTIIFKETITIVNLLSFGKKFNIFENYNFYNLEKLDLLFREFEKKLQEQKKKNEKDFLLIFNQYVSLIEIINELCLINSTDVLRKKTINPLINSISETINMTKFNVQLNDHQINTLNNILGKLLFYYSHIPYINTTNKESQYLIDEFKFNFEKLCDGYNLSKNTNFGGDINKEEYYKIFLNSTTTLLLTLIYKLENTYALEEFNNIKQFENIIELYHCEIEHSKMQVFVTLDDFKKSLLQNYSFIYFNKLNSTNYLNIIDDFLKNSNFDSTNMIILHSLVLFSSEIEEKKLLKILKILISKEKFVNDYHEFYKLNICDVIINKFVYSKNHILNKELIDDLIKYIELNKIASHLMSIYSKVYLSLSRYYSYFEDYKSIESSKLYYFNYVAINGKELLENEYLKLHKDILYNHGKKTIMDMDLENVAISNSKCIQIGTKVLNKYFEQEEINLKYSINQKLSNIVTEIFTDEGLDDDLLNKHIENFISRDIFHGLTFVSIEGLCSKECTLIDLGYEKIDIPLIDGYKLRMAYSYVYKNIFENIYINNKEYIKQNIINLIISYIKSIPIYHDPITKLFNLNKLKTELLSNENDELIFVELYIEDLIILNKRYNYEKTNLLFKEYAEKIDNIVKTYRLTGPKLGFILDVNADYKTIIKDIRKINISYNEDILKPNLVFSVSWGNKNNIIEKGAHCMSLAQDSNEKYYEFK